MKNKKKIKTVGVIGRGRWGKSYQSSGEIFIYKICRR